MAEDKYWLGGNPKLDDFQKLVGDEFIDGKTKHGPWAIMTPGSWIVHGLGRLGTGFGQRYQKQPDGRYKKVEG